MSWQLFVGVAYTALGLEGQVPHVLAQFASIQFLLHPCPGGASVAQCLLTSSVLPSHTQPFFVGLPHAGLTLEGQVPHVLAQFASIQDLLHPCDGGSSVAQFLPMSCVMPSHTQSFFVGVAHAGLALEGQVPHVLAH